MGQDSSDMKVSRNFSQRLDARIPHGSADRDGRMVQFASGLARVLTSSAILWKFVNVLYGAEGILNG